MKHMIAILTWLGLSAGMLHAHYFDVAIVVPPGDGQAAMQAFLLASAERDGHPDETSDGHLGGLDSHVTIVENGDHADAQAIRPDSAAPHIIVAISTQVPDGLRYPDAWTFRVTRVSDRAAREYLNAGVLGRVASITGQARSTLTRENGQPTDSNLAQPSSVILLRARTPICASVF